jgi:type II secretory pathway component GspD/PulD (secretin)
MTAIALFGGPGPVTRIGLVLAMCLAALPAARALPAAYRIEPGPAPAAPLAAGDPLDAPVRTFRIHQTGIAAALLAVSRLTGIAIVVDPAASGDVTLEMRDGTVRQLLDALTLSRGLYWRREGPLVAVRRNVTRFYEIDYPQLIRSADGGSNVNLSAQSGAVAAATAGGQTASAAATSNGGTPGDQTSLAIELQNRNTFWADVQSELGGLAEPGETTAINRFAGLAVVTAPPYRQPDFRDFIETVNRRVSRQVRITARVVEVELDSQHQLGVDWTLAGTKAGGLSLAGGSSTLFSTLGGQTLIPATVSGTLSAGKVSAVIQALQEQGSVHAVSNPSVLSLSNQTAFVKVGTEQTFFSLSNATTITQTGATGPVATTQSSYTQNAITIGTVLYVTPELNGDGTVTVDVLPAITQLVAVDTSPDGEQTAPRMDIKALSTIARLHPQESVMIGGLIYDASSSQSQKVPILGDLPLLGRAFGTSAGTKTRTELVIFLTAEPVG